MSVGGATSDHDSSAPSRIPNGDDLARQRPPVPLLPMTIVRPQCADCTGPGLSVADQTTFRRRDWQCSSCRASQSPNPAASDWSAARARASRVALRAGRRRRQDPMRHCCSSRRRVHRPGGSPSGALALPAADDEAHVMILKLRICGPRGARV